MRIRKVLTTAMAACLAAGALAGYGSKKSDEKIIKIGVLGPTTGESRGGGHREVLGIRYARGTYSTVSMGGEEYTIKLAEADNRSNKIEAVSAAQKLVSEKVSVVLGSYSSGVPIIAGQIFTDAKIPAIGCSCTSPQVTEGSDSYFRIYFIGSLQDTVMVNYVYQNGAKNAAVITQLGDNYSSSLGPYFENAFAKLGGSIVSEEQFQTSQTDFRTILTDIKAADPGIIFVPSSITTTPLIIKQTRGFGIIVTITVGDTRGNSTITENTGADSEGIVLSTFFDETEPANNGAAAFIKGFKEYLIKEKQENIIPAVSALDYDSYLAVIKTIEGANFTDTATIRDALKNVEVDGVAGNITFNETGGANKDIAFIKTTKDGRFQLLTTTTVE